MFIKISGSETIAAQRINIFCRVALTAAIACGKKEYIKDYSSSKYG